MHGNVGAHFAAISDGLREHSEGIAGNGFSKMLLCHPEQVFRFGNREELDLAIRPGFWSFDLVNRGSIAPSLFRRPPPEFFSSPQVSV